MKIYTKTGDDGTTGLFSGKRVSKADLRVEVYGSIDELNTVVGILTTLKLPEDIKNTIKIINNLLFIAGADLASPTDSKNSSEIRISEKEIIWLESMIDAYDMELPKLNNFILPGGTIESANFHNARAVCRRAERLAVSLADIENIGEFIVKFLNRLSDFLFTAARLVNYRAGVPDELWNKDVLK